MDDYPVDNQLDSFEHNFEMEELHQKAVNEDVGIKYNNDLDGLKMVDNSWLELEFEQEYMLEALKKFNFPFETFFRIYLQ